MAKPTASRLRRSVAGTLLLALLALTVPGCSGGGGGAVQTLIDQAVAAAFAGYFAGVTVLGDGQMLRNAAGDLDGDGLPDLVASSLGGGAGLAVSLAVAPGQYGEPASVALPGGVAPFEVLLADLDEDGLLDLATTNLAGTDAVVLLGNGDGTFGAGSLVPLGIADVAGAVAGDFDGDGHLDLAAVSNDTDTVAVALGNGDGTFGAATQFATGQSNQVLLATADVTGDGNLDLAVPDSDTTTVVVLEGDGNGGFDGLPTRVAFPGSSGPGGGPRLPDLLEGLRQAGPRERLNLLTDVEMPGSTVGIVLEDFDGDADVDIAVALLEVVQPTQAGPAGGVGVALNQGGGTFGAGTLTPVSGGFNLGLTSGDYDGDGGVDLAMACAGTNHVLVLRGDGLGGFAEVGAHDAGIAPGYGLLTADLDRDGHEDLAVCNLLFSNQTILRGLGGGDFQSTPAYGLGVESELNPLAAGDVDGDGLDDLVAGAQDNPDLAVLLNNGDGTFADPTPMDPGFIISALALGDMDGDGFPDAVAVDPAGQEVDVLLNDGQGSFGPGQGFPLVEDPSRLALADFDQDGDLDVAVTSANATSVEVFPGNGDGTLDPSESFDLGIPAFYPTVGDFDGDGFPDLAVGGADGPFLDGVGPVNEQVAVVLNDGSGGFGSPSLLEAESSVQAVASADFDGDGFPDLAATGVLEGTIPTGQLTLYLNQGDGTFGAGTVVAEGGALPVDMFSGDLDGDGFQDLAILDFYMSTYVVAYGDGQGAFPRASAWNAGAAPVFGAVGNFNGDALADLAASNALIGVSRGDLVPEVHVLNTVFR